MGRRHFNFSPAVRGSLGSSVVWPPHAERRHGQPPQQLCDTAPSFTTSRRMFRHAEDWFEEPAPFVPSKRVGYQQAIASYSDSNPEASSLNDLQAKRRCAAPPFGKGKEPEPCQRRHYVPGDDFASLQHPQLQGKDLSCHKRHVPPPTGHLVGEGQVWRDDASPCERRHCPDSTSLHAERRSLMAPERRHLATEDHLRGPSVFATVRIPPICGDRKGRHYSSSCSWSPAITVEPRDEVSHSSLVRRPGRPLRRGAKAPRDHLVGAIARPTSAPAGSARPLKRRSHSEITGSSLECSGLVRLTAMASPTISPFVPDDHLFGWEVL